MTTGVSIRRSLLLALAALPVVAGCGGGADATTPSSATGGAPVVGTLGLDRTAAGAPDGGTVAGHRGGGYEAKVEGPVLAFAGRVRPATAKVEVTGAPHRVAGDGSGRFVVRLTGLPRSTELDLVARDARRARGPNG